MISTTSVYFLIYLCVLSYITQPGVVFKAPFKNPVLVALTHALLFIALLALVKPLFTEKEGYANNVPFNQNASTVYDYCMNINRPPFMGSIRDTINHCLDRISGSGYVPFSSKNTPKKVRFSM
jgi:hypothetical protein